MGKTDLIREQTEFMETLYESIKVELEDPSSGLLASIDTTKREQLRDLRRMAMSVEKSKNIVRSLLDHFGMERSAVIGSFLDYDLSNLASELINLADGHRSKLLVADETKPGFGRVIDHPFQFRLRKLGLVYLRIQAELGESQKRAAYRVARETNGMLTLNKLRYFRRRLIEINSEDQIDRSFHQWFQTSGGVELSDSPTLEQRRAVLLRASKKALVLLSRYSAEAAV